MNPSRIFIERPVATALLMASILLAGLVSFTQLPVSALPEVDYPTIQVLTFYPGAAPDVMAATVTAPLERQFGEMPGLQQMTSTSSDGMSLIVLEFNLTLSLDIAEQEVQAAMNSSQSFLPSDLPAPPIYSKINPADAPVLTLGITSASLPLSQVEDLVDTRLVPKLSQLDGVGLVTLEGGQKPAVRIEANPAQLGAHGLTMEDLRSALVAASVKAAKGNFDGPRLDYQIDSNDQIADAAGYNNVVVAYRDGAPVFVKDVATVANGVENDSLAAWMNRTPAIILSIQRQPGANTIAVVRNIESVLPTITAGLPVSIRVATLGDLTVSIAASVHDVEFELLLTIGLVVLVIFLFLRSARATLIPSVAVPLSLVGTFGAMYLLGYSLDNLSLMSLTIATGFVVDDAIVMIENISRYIEAGETPLQAAFHGSAQIGFTILSLTVSLIAVLIPLLFMGDVVGRLFREFAVTLAVTIVLSAVVSLTLTPMMAGRILRPARSQGRVFRASDWVFERLGAFYARTLRGVLRHQTATLLVAAATMLLTVVLYIVVPKGFFPTQDTGVIQGITQAPASISFAAMAARQQQVSAIVLDDPAVANVASFIGVDGTNTTLNSGRIQISLKPLAARHHLSATGVIARLQRRLQPVSGITLYMQPVQNITVNDRVTRTLYQYTLEDPSADELQTWAQAFLNRLDRLPQLADIATDIQAGAPALQLNLDRVTASRLGITPTMLDDTLYDSYGQRQINTLYTALNQYHVILETAAPWRRSPGDLDRLFLQGAAAGSNATTSPLYTPGASPLAALPTALAAAPRALASPTATPPAPVPLSTFLQVQPTTEALTVNRQGQFPSVTFSFNLADGVALGTAIDAINRVVAQLHFPPSVQAAFQGAAAAFQNSLSDEPLLILAALVVVYIVLGVLYESTIHPVTILSTLPSAGVGALLALLITGQSLDVVGIIGIVLLIGIVKKNGILVVDFALEAEREHGRSATEAAYEASLLRFRPILMTTMAALLAGLPLALGRGLGSELRRPLGITMIGGLLVSQLLTFYTTPVIYIFFDKLGARLRGRREAR